MADQDDQEKTLRLLAKLLDNREGAEKIRKELGKNASAAVELLKMSQETPPAGKCGFCGREPWPTPSAHAIVLAWACVAFAIISSAILTWSVSHASSLQPNLVWLVLIVLTVPLLFVIALFRLATRHVDS